MGSEDIKKKKREALQAVNLKRKQATKSSKDTVLIVCEGSKTEPLYIKSLIIHFGLQQRVDQGEVTVDSRKTGLDPSRLVDRAIKLFDEKQAEGFTYDNVYCVFDKDCHSQYESACLKIKKQPLKKKRGTMHAITSVPCFEVWLLLHFTSSSAPFHASGSRSVCDRVIAKLKAIRELKNYEKGGEDAFSTTKDRLQTARNNAKMIWDARDSNGDNPSTLVFQLVNDLEKLLKYGEI